ncbi:MAG: hypothetical protein IKC48_04090 [Clostridia bacterium]|nr:hypothetical protein [Clostridia bacterium]
MIFISAEDFFAKAEAAVRLSREDEVAFALLARAGDFIARDKIIDSYLGVVAAHIKRLSPQLQTLDVVYRCKSVLEQAVDEFDFTQNSEPFIHRLNLALRQAIAEHIAIM